MPAAPRKPVQSLGDIGFDDLRSSHPAHRQANRSPRRRSVQSRLVSRSVNYSSSSSSKSSSSSNSSYSSNSSSSSNSSYSSTSSSSGSGIPASFHCFSSV